MGSNGRVVEVLWEVEVDEVEVLEVLVEVVIDVDVEVELVLRLVLLLVL